MRPRANSSTHLFDIRPQFGPKVTTPPWSDTLAWVVIIPVKCFKSEFCLLMAPIVIQFP